MRYIIIPVIILFASCTTQKKVNRWLNENPVKAAEYCADKFPVKESVDTTYKVDSAAYEEAYRELWGYADSLLAEYEKLYSAKSTPEKPVLAADNSTPINVDSLRKQISAKIRKSLKPCIDSIQTVVIKQVDSAKVYALQGRIDEKDKVISARDKTISEKEAKIKAQKKWVWMFFGLLLLIAAYIFGKMKFGFKLF